MPPRAKREFEPPDTVAARDGGAQDVAGRGLNHGALNDR